MVCWIGVLTNIFYPNCLALRIRTQYAGKSVIPVLTLYIDVQAQNDIHVASQKAICVILFKISWSEHGKSRLQERTSDIRQKLFTYMRNVQANHPSSAPSTRYALVVIPLFPMVSSHVIVVEESKPLKPNAIE